MAAGTMSADLPVCTVLGPGTMGAQIALSLALGGATVRLWGRRAEALSPAMERCGEGFDFLAAEGLADPSERTQILTRITPSPGLPGAVEGAGFVIEAAAEDIAVKQDLLAQAEAAARSDAILSSTTSALSASAIQSALKRPGNFCIAHYAQPAHLVELVEVVPGAKSSDQAVKVTTDLLLATGKTPVLCPDIPGFLWARIQHAVLREFASLVGKGLVTPEACDTILKIGYASRLPAMGAFEHADLAGLDLINSDAAKAVWADLSNVTDPGETPVGALLEEGKLGMKSGQGFYNWRERNPEDFKATRDAEIVRRVKINRGGRVR
ncbi:3-hydroxyacyl-CoA dehydrogenase family protein [Hoeflea poritis]|uniref:L-gulonate 3-dehydrogenase n=1 Tax=Hoeflea poritis TaxID=2993659 RepID=A0ABT4VUI3_9HYPH|nr:3-hydroxyacyl-CoA dehydrogenase family protein [Hoeflea poritis]MDA4848368.1 3-hydroxyacyl-CoA dehydrogenase family protein [Hoeflea poritis]